MKIKTTGQFGEYIVAAELCRRNLIATTFTRNMPGFDILALDQISNRSLRIQVKTVKSGQWSLNAKRYLKFDMEKFEKKNIQEVTGIKKDNETDFAIFVKMNEYGKDLFYILKNDELKKIIYKNYTDFLKRVNGKRPKNPKTTHTALHVCNLEPYENKWAEITEQKDDR